MKSYRKKMRCAGLTLFTVEVSLVIRKWHIEFELSYLKFAVRLVCSAFGQVNSHFISVQSQDTGRPQFTDDDKAI